MELEEAKDVVEALANGVDPVTGEVFAEDSPCNDPRIIRALSDHSERSRGATTSELAKQGPIEKDPVQARSGPSVSADTGPPV